jgi:hypothetical protein
MKLGGNERKKIKEEIILSYDEEIDGCSFFFELFTFKNILLEIFSYKIYTIRRYFMV